MPEAGEIQEILDRIEGEVSKGNYALRELGFWKIVSSVKRDPSLIEKFGDQIGRIDQEVFRERAWLAVDAKLGHVVELIGTIFGVALIFYGLQNPGTVMGVSFVLSAFVLMTTLHPLSHYIVGRYFGIGFTFYFPDGPAMIEPTLKTDYASYLKSSPRSRAMMHAIGPIVSTSVLLATGIMAFAYGAPTWSYLLLSALFLLNIPNEIMPPILIKIGLKKILFADLHKTDTYRALREWRIHRELRS